MKICTGQFHEADTVLRIERFDKIAKVGFVKFGNDFLEKRGIRRLNRARNLGNKLVTNVAVGDTESTDPVSSRSGSRITRTAEPGR